MSRSHKSAAWAVCAAIGFAATLGCTGSRPPPPQNLPPPVQSTSIGQGDVFSVTIVGEKDLPSDYRVTAEGTVDFPYIGKIAVAGLEPQMVADLIKKKLVEAKILTDPQLSLIVKEYNSKRVSVIGQVAKPGAVAFSDGMKLVDALSQAGWFTAIADSNHVILTRVTGPTRTVTAVISVDAITDGQQADIPLQSGDTVKVEARVF
jgi:polysaccharide export outer membrane protein